MNEQLNKFKPGDIVLGKVIEIEPVKALIKIEGCEPVYIIKEVTSVHKIESIEEVLELNQIYEFLIVIDYGGIYYKYDEYYLSIIDLERLRSKKRIEQLFKYNVTIYSEVIEAFNYGVLVTIENQDFIVSNIHLQTNVPNQELVGIKIPLKIFAIQNDYGYTDTFVSHRWALDNKNGRQLYKLDDIVVGKVVKIENKYALIDIGTEKLAYIALREISFWAESCEEFLHLNLTREFIINKVYYGTGLGLGLSIQKLEHNIGCKRIRQIRDSNVIFDLVYYSNSFKKYINNRGYSVKIEGLKAFLPCNHIDSSFIDNENFNQKTPLQIIEFKERCTLYISNIKVLGRLKLKQINIGDLITGKILAIKKYGLIIRTDGLAVLLHISEVSQITVNPKDLKNIFQVGNNIKAMVIWMDKEKSRVAVSTKELEKEPGDIFENPQLVYKNAEEMAMRYRKLVLNNLNYDDSPN